MPKMKTKKALMKRFRITKKGKVKRTRAGKSHLLSTKSGARRRRLRRPGLCTPTDANRIKKALGM